MADRDVLVGVREDVMLDDVGKQLEAQAAKEKKEKEEEEARARAAAAAAAAGQSPEAARIAALENALRISEEARKRQENLPGREPAPPAPEPKPKLTREQLKELHEKDPLAAIEYLLEGTVALQNENLERRLTPLVSGGLEAQKAAARARYPDEFELFGSEIEHMLKDPRIDQKALSQPKAWDDLISYIRGNNFDKLVEHRGKRDRDRAQREAQERERAAAGTHAAGGERRPPPPAVETGLDKTEQTIALGLFPHLSEDEAYKEYTKWKGVTSR